MFFYCRPEPADDKGNVAGVCAGASCFDRALRGLGNLPPFTPVLARLVATLGSDDISFSEIAGLIERDTVLAGHVLRVVNSALYGFRGTVNSVRRAVSLMGVVKLRNTALSLSIAGLWARVKTPGNWSMQAFNRHSVAAGIMSDLIAQRVPAHYAEGAFTAGLLHDVGKLLITVTLPAEWEQVTLMGAGTAAERDVLGFDHAELSGVIQGRWNLPEPIRIAAARHHEPRGAEDGVHRLEDVVAAADRAVAAAGFMSAGTVPAGEPDLPEMLDSLDPASLERLAAEFRAEFDTVREFF